MPRGALARRKETVMHMFRQGDVLLVRVDEGRTGELQPRDALGRVVLAEGEATGHAHAILEPGADLYGDDLNRRFLEILTEGGVDLVHEEHATIHLPPGTYQVVRQREYEYRSSNQWSWVAD